MDEKKVAFITGGTRGIGKAIAKIFSDNGYNLVINYVSEKTDLKKLEELGKTKQNSFTIEQLLDESLKNVDGESRMEVTNRMEKAFNRVFFENLGKKIAIVSHGASIKFLLMKWCNLNSNHQLEFRGKMINLNSPGVLKLEFNNEDLVKLVQVV